MISLFLVVGVILLFLGYLVSPPKKGRRKNKKFPKRRKRSWIEKFSVSSTSTIFNTRDNSGRPSDPGTAYNIPTPALEGEQCGRKDGRCVPATAVSGKGYQYNYLQAQNNTKNISPEDFGPF